MEKKNKNAKELKEAWFALTKKKQRLEKEIRDRLLWLAANNPDAIIDVMIGTEIKAKSIASTRAVDNLEISLCILTIQRIEEWLNALHPHKQLTIEEFNKI